MFPWFSFFTYMLVSGLTPGPNNIMAMSVGSRRGLLQSFPFIFGVSVGFLFVVSLCTLFCSFLSELIPAIQTPMLWIGCLYILRLAWLTFRSDSGIHEAENRDGFLSGLFLQFVNPKLYVACIMSLEAYIIPYFQGQFFPLLCYVLFFALTGILFPLTWAVFGSVFQRLFSEHTRAVNTVMALLLVYCALSLLL